MEDFCNIPNNLITEYKKSIYSTSVFAIREHMRSQHKWLFSLICVLFICTLLSLGYLFYSNEPMFVIPPYIIIFVIAIIFWRYDEKYKLSSKNRLNRLEALEILLKNLIDGFDFSNHNTIEILKFQLSEYIKKPVPFLGIVNKIKSFWGSSAFPVLLFFAGICVKNISFSFVECINYSIIAIIILGALYMVFEGIYSFFQDIFCSNHKIVIALLSDLQRLQLKNAATKKVHYSVKVEK